MKKKLIFIIFLFVFAFIQANTKVRILEKEKDNDVVHTYFSDLLDLILKKTESDYGEYSIENVKIEASKSRQLLEIQKGRKLDLLWAMTSGERERNLRAIRIPLVKGLWGYRIFIIKKESKKKFEKVKNITQLNEYIAAQGHDWSDTQILQANGIKLITSSKYANLFNMLEADRYDYFPRALSEPWSEVEKFGEGKLVVEENLMLRYRAPIYYFVNKENPLLAERLEVGFERAIEDGSFDEYFYNNPLIMEAFKKAKVSNRIVFDLRNPFLTKESKKISKIRKYWYEVGDEQNYIKNN